MVSSLKMILSSQSFPSFDISVKNNTINRLTLVVALIGIGILLKKIYDIYNQRTNNHNQISKIYVDETSCIQVNGIKIPSYSKKIKKYGNETISSIDCKGNVELNGTTVNGNAAAGGNLRAVNTTVNSIDAGGSISSIDCKGNVELNGTTVNGNAAAGGNLRAVNATVNSIDAGGSLTADNSSAKSLRAGGSITVSNSKVQGNVHAGGSIEGKDNSELGDINADGSVDLSYCTINSVISKSKIDLIESHVKGDLSFIKEATIKNSTIHGTLTGTTNHLIIEDSKINAINLKYFHHNPIRKNGSRDIVVHNHTVYKNSDGMETVNGVPLKQFQAQNNSGTQQTLELRNCTVGNVNFEGNDGKIILKDSKITGQISGGKVIPTTWGVKMTQLIHHI